MEFTAEPDQTITFRLVDSENFVLSFKMYKNEPIQKAIKEYVERTNKQIEVIINEISV